MNNIYINNSIQPPPQALEKSFETNFKEKVDNFLEDLNEIEQIIEIEEKTNTNFNQLNKLINQLNHLNKNDSEIEKIKTKLKALINQLFNKGSKQIINIIVNEINKLRDDNVNLKQFKTQLLNSIK
jgi:hypothetical protein